jgi:hypothetical protein
MGDETSSPGCGCFPVLFAATLLIGFGWIRLPSIDGQAVDEVLKSTKGVRVNVSDTGVQIKLESDTQPIGTEQNQSEGGFYEE